MQLQVRDASRDLSEALDPVYLLQNQSQHKALYSQKTELLTQTVFFFSNLREICLLASEKLEQFWNLNLWENIRILPVKALHQIQTETFWLQFVQ